MTTKVESTENSLVALPYVSGLEYQFSESELKLFENFGEKSDEVKKTVSNSLINGNLNKFLESTGHSVSEYINVLLALSMPKISSERAKEIADIFSSR